MFVLIAPLFWLPPPANAELAERAAAILTTHCQRCHGETGGAKGGFNYVLDRDKLVDRRKLTPGDPDSSPLFARIHDGEMPPENVKRRLTPADVGVLKDWICAGAPARRTAVALRQRISEAALVQAMRADLNTIPPRQRHFMRYFTLTHLVNAGTTQRDLQIYRQALTKLVNSLSWHPRITAPLPIDAANAILRIDLRDYQWNAQTWSRVLSLYPHSLPVKHPAYQEIQRATRTELPYVRADWFVAFGSRPPLYQDILQLPLTDRDLERLLRVDAALNIREERVIRSGFNGSGVAKNNRLLERHDAAYGAYWKSYDFSDNVDRQNLFERPLGPQFVPGGFIQAGGEMIFGLPNGLHGYFVADGNGRRIDRAPVEIVSDPKRPDRVVETGVSCFSCHFRGLHFKADQIRQHVLKNPAAFAKEDVESVKAMYPVEVRFKALVDDDVKRYLTALAKTGAVGAEPEPILALTLRYEAELDLANAAAEVGLNAQEFAAMLKRSALVRSLGPLLVRGGTVQRQVFLTVLPELLRELNSADAHRLSADSSTPTKASPPFSGHQGHILCVAFSPDGRKALTGSEDNTARIWSVADGREVRSLIGHTDEVLSAAFSPDGKQVLTGSADRTMRLWDALSGRELRRFDGHTERVSSVAFSPDGRKALSGSWDHSVSLWDVATGNELRRLGGHTSYVTSVAFSPDSRQALSGSYDQSVRLWNLDSGREVRRMTGHAKEVYCVALAPSGRTAASGSNDHSIRLWDLATGREIKNLKGHASAVISVAFGADGKSLLSASSQYRGSEVSLWIWDIENGKKRSRIDGRDQTIWCAAFSRDGRKALTGNSDKALRLWQLPQ